MEKLQTQINNILAYRRFLVRTDENIKAYKFINQASKVINSPWLKDAAELTFKQVGHCYDPGLYKRFYNENISEQPIPEDAVMNDQNFPDRLRWVKNLFKRYTPKTVLDLGCSEGSYSLNIANEGYDVTGVNLFKSSIAVGNERAAKFGLAERARFIQSDIMEFETDMRFDAVMLFEVIEHVPDPKAMVEKMMSLTTPEGVCYISTPNGTADEKASALGVDLENAAGGEFKGHVRVFTEESLRELVKEYEVLDFYNSETDYFKLLHIAFRKKNDKKT